MKRLPVVGADAGLAPVETVGRVAVTVTGSTDDAGALRFARALAESMNASLWTAGEMPAAPVVATGLALTRGLDARLRVVISGGVSRRGWRDPRLPCDLELTDVRLELARALGARLAAQAKSW